MDGVGAERRGGRSDPAPLPFPSPRAFDQMPLSFVFWRTARQYQVTLTAPDGLVDVTQAFTKTITNASMPGRIRTQN